MAPHRRSQLPLAHRTSRPQTPQRQQGPTTVFAFGDRRILSPLAYLTPGTETDDLSVLVLGTAIAARVLEAAPYDPDNDLPRDAPGA